MNDKLKLFNEYHWHNCPECDCRWPCKDCETGTAIICSKYIQIKELTELIKTIFRNCYDNIPDNLRNKAWDLGIRNFSVSPLECDGST